MRGDYAVQLELDKKSTWRLVRGSIFWTAPDVSHRSATYKNNCSEWKKAASKQHVRWQFALASVAMELSAAQPEPSRTNFCWTGWQSQKDLASPENWRHFQVALQNCMCLAFANDHLISQCHLHEYCPTAANKRALQLQALNSNKKWSRRYPVACQIYLCSGGVEP